MKQRGRKSKTQLRVVGSKPKLVTSNNLDDPPRPPNHLGEPEQQIWNAVIGDWKGNGASYFVLLSGLEAHQRAREAREIIDDEGMTINCNGTPSTDRRKFRFAETVGGSRPHTCGVGASQRHFA